MSFDSVIDRLRAIQAASMPNSKEIRTTLHTAGTILRAEMVMNVRRQALIDTGNLINSIKYVIDQDEGKTILRVGSFGVPYAAVHEFGFRGAVNIREHARTTKSGKSAQVRAHSRNVNIRSRPYVRPALEKHAAKIADLLREAAFAAKK